MQSNIKQKRLRMGRCR